MVTDMLVPLSFVRNHTRMRSESREQVSRMVEKNVSGAYTQIVYSPLGKKFAVMSGQTLVQGFIPLPTGAKAIYTPTGLTYYRHHDHLGSSRLATTPSRTMCSSTAYAPFGEPYKTAGTTDLSFTGKDQDTASGIHDFQDRNYIAVQGRWFAPDPAGLAAVDPSSPQSWNRYAYVSNNPLALIDPFGDDGCYALGDASCGGQYYGGGAYDPGNPGLGYAPSASPPGLNPTNGSIQNMNNTTPWFSSSGPGEFDLLLGAQGELANGITPGTAAAVGDLAALWNSPWKASWKSPGGSAPPPGWSPLLEALDSVLAGYFPGSFNGLPPGPSWSTYAKQSCAQAAQAIETWIKQNGTTEPPPEYLLLATITCGQNPIGEP